MKKKLPWAVGKAVSLLLAACLLTGCAGLLERSYSVLEPYADRYWDSNAEDTLRAESYQDLVNSMLLLIEQHAEEGVIRCYGEIGTYQNALAARSEVQRETMLGSYLLQNLHLSYEQGSSYSTLTCRIIYREDAEDIDSLMTLSDSQSLVDLLRMAVREEHEKLTAHFAYDTPREDVNAAVESLWQELCQAEAEAEGTPDNMEALEPGPEETGDDVPPDEDSPEMAAEGMPDDGPEDSAPDGDNAEAPAEAAPEEEPVVYPPCPWVILFYPDQATAEIVEVILQG